MNIAGFIWLENIIEKLWRKHKVEPFEVEEVFANFPFFRFVEKGNRKGEDFYAALGQTNSGRYLVTFFVYKQDKLAVVISSRTMTEYRKEEL